MSRGLKGRKEREGCCSTTPLIINSNHCVRQQRIASHAQLRVLSSQPSAWEAYSRKNHQQKPGNLPAVPFQLQGSTTYLSPPTIVRPLMVHDHSSTSGPFRTPSSHVFIQALLFSGRLISPELNLGNQFGIQSIPLLRLGTGRGPGSTTHPRRSSTRTFAIADDRSLPSSNWKQFRISG